jgi:hypothetical protein
VSVLNENPLGVLRGAPEIAKAIGTTPRRAYYLLENKILPGVKEGNLWTCTLDSLRRFYEGQGQMPDAARIAEPERTS